MSDSLLDGFEVPITCSDCRHETKKSVAWLRANTEFNCPNCGALLDLKGYDFAGLWESADEAVDGLRKDLGRVQKKVR